MQLSIFNLPALRRFSMGLNRTRTIDRFECIQAPRNKSCWWAQMDSNHRPHAYQACALTNWAMSPFLVEINGFEPLTPCLQGRCSSQLSYTPIPKTTIRSSVLPFPPGTLYKTNAPLFFGALSLHQLKMIEENKSSLNPVPVSTRILVNILLYVDDSP